MIPFTSSNRLIFVCCIAVLFLFPLLAAAAPTAQEIPCTELPECYPPPPPSNQPQADNSPVDAAWGGYGDGRLNPEMAEYYSIWCLDDVVRVLRGVPTTALVDDIPLMDVSNLSNGATLSRDSGLMVVRNDDMIAVSGNNGNNASQPGLKIFSLEECLERNGRVSIEQPIVTTDNMVQQAAINLAESTAEVTAETGQEESENNGNRWPDLPGNNDYANLEWWIINFVEDICGVPLGAVVLMIPAGWTAWSRRKRRAG